MAMVATTSASISAQWASIKEDAAISRENAAISRERLRVLHTAGAAKHKVDSEILLAQHAIGSHVDTTPHKFKWEFWGKGGLFWSPIRMGHWSFQFPSEQSLPNPLMV